MKIPFNADQLTRSIVAARKIVAAFDANQAALLARAYGRIPDGYPSGGQGGGRANDISDPTQRAALARAYGDVGPAIRALQHLDKACRSLDAASTELSAALPPAPVTTNADDVWCTNHLRHRMLEPRGDRRGDLCRWCHDFRGAHGVLPPAELLELRSRRGRVYERDVAAALARLAEAS